MMFFLTLLDTEEEKKKFIELYDTYKDLLYWIAFSKVNNIEDAEDCVQETFFYVAKNFNKIGEIIVLTTTTITIGPNIILESSPSSAPLLATIRATSPLDTIPVPI